MRRSHLSVVLHPAWLALVVAGVLASSGCSGKDEPGGLGSEAGGSKSTAGNNPIDIGSRPGTGSGGSAGGANVSTGGGNQCQLEDDGSGCVGQAYEGETLPLDLYIMFDQSGSMCSCIDPVGGQLCPDPDCSETRLDAVRAATAAFLSDPASAGIGVGIGYFGKQPIGSASCDVADYSAPAVPIGTLPEHAGAITDSLSAIAPTGETPSGAAIRGACEYARSHKAEHPEREVVLLLDRDVRTMPDVYSFEPGHIPQKSFDNKLVLPGGIPEWARRHKVRYYLYQRPSHPWRLWHFHLPEWLHRAAGGQEPAGPANGWVLYSAENGWCEPIDVPRTSERITRVPGL